MRANTMHARFMQAKHFCITKHRDRQHDGDTEVDNNVYLTNGNGAFLVTSDGKFLIK